MNSPNPESRIPTPGLFGLLNIHKPIGVTSRDVVNVVQRMVRPAKTGHAGTLDPLAEGVLVVCIGPATRLIEYVQRMPKRYRGEFLLGRESPTEDIEGPVTELVDPPIPTRDQLTAAASTMLGTIEQLPPQYSALKVGGVRAYDAARRGESVDLAPRPIEIYELTIVEYDYPRLILEVRCGSGTYIRSLGRDLAAKLGTAAVMSALVRTEIGPFTLATATKLDNLTAATLPAAIQPATLAVSNLPQRILTATELVEITAGRNIAAANANAEETVTEEIAAAEIAAVDAAGILRAILVPRGPNQLGPNRVFNP
jgi:tRNA pseudouridine55 synthase